MEINDTKLNAFTGRFVEAPGAVMHAATIVEDDRLGLFKRLAYGPTDVESLARLTETDSRYLRKCLSVQAASGYVVRPIWSAAGCLRWKASRHASRQAPG